jgi:lysophospholipase L1-like esterase
VAVLLAGDSTVAACPPHEAPMSGWGASLGGALPAGSAVRSFATGGATTASFRADGLWGALLAEARPGDVVLLGFGHNDQKSTEPDALERFTERLHAMVDDVAARRGRAVLCTPVQRRRFVAGALVDTHGGYPAAIRDLAARLGAGVVDLTALTTTLLQDAGEEGSRALLTHLPAGAHPNYPDGIADDTHVSFTGADAVAALVADRILPLLEEENR